MAITVEELISKVTVQGAATFVADMGRIGRASANAAQKIGSEFQRTASILRSFKFLAGLGIGAGVGLFGFGEAALKASANAEDFRTTLESLTGSMDKVNKKSEFIRNLDIPAKAGLAQLRAAGLSVESFGLRIEKVLPLVAKLQAAFPQKDIQEAVRLFGRLAQGDFPDIENLSGFGLSKAQFIQRGIKFDANGTLLSSAKDTMDALENIVNSKYGNILEKIAANTSSKTASLASSWTRAMEQIGNAIKTAALPIIERLTASLDKMTANGGLEKWANTVIGNFFRIVSAVFLTISAIGALMIVIAIFTKNLILGLKGAAIAVIGFAGALYFAQKFKELKLQKGNPNAPPTNPAMPEDQNPELGWGQVSDPIRQIAGNTRITAENTKPLADFAKAVFGGGALGRLGITPVELAGFRRGGGGNQIVFNIEGGNVDQIQQQILSLKRRGLL